MPCAGVAPTIDIVVKQQALCRNDEILRRLLDEAWTKLWQLSASTEDSRFYSRQLEKINRSWFNWLLGNDPLRGFMVGDRVNFRTRLLCEILLGADRHSNADWNHLQVLSVELVAWWRDHKRADDEREIAGVSRPRP